MNKALAAASVVAFATAGIHIVAGGADTAAPLLAAPLDETVKLTLYAVWHMASVVLVLSALALALAALRPSATGAVRMIGGLWLASGLVFVAVALAHRGAEGLIALPQWLLLLPVGLLALWGARGRA